jgi:Cft2 family RNA processing exonuclease
MFARAGELGSEDFEATLRGADDPRRMVAVALFSAEQDLVEAAVPWAIDPTRIPTSDRVDDSPAEDVLLAQPERVEPVPLELDHEVDRTDAESSDAESLRAREELENERADRRALEETLTGLTNELAAAQATVRRLEATNLTLKARVPSKRDRARTNKQKGELDKAAATLDKAAVELAAARAECEQLLEQRRVLSEELLEAREHRARAEKKSQRLEERLASSGGRAEYLRRSLTADLEDARCRVDESQEGIAKTRARKRCDELDALIAMLDAVFPVDTRDEIAATPTPPIVAAGRDVVVLPVGGGEEIGGSALLISAGDQRLLIDAGLHPDGRGPRDIQQVIDGGRLDAIIVTHAHNDHAGYIPALLERFPRAHVITSGATAQLLPTMWTDSAKVMERAYAEAADGSVATAPLYGQVQVELAEDRIVDLHTGRQHRVGGLEVTLFPAGHILGAAGVVITADDRKVVVTGDISGPEDHYLSVERARLPERLAADADLLVIESTYCHEDHSGRQIEVDQLVSHAKRIVERGGRVLIPAFGLGRAQEVAMILADGLPDVEILVDGLARDISDIYERAAERDGYELRVLGGNVRRVENRMRELRSFHSGVIVSSSGMLTGGPSVEWAKHILTDPNSALLLCGYQDEDAPGRRLEDLATKGAGKRRFFLPDRELGEVEIEVRAEVSRYKLSAHADRRGLLEITNVLAPRSVMLVHGEARHQPEFRSKLSACGFNPVPTARWAR